MAVLVPVAPAAGWATSAVSMATWAWPEALELSSPRSVIPAGGVMAAAPSWANRPTIMALATVVVTDVAAIDVLAVLVSWPLETSIGLAVSTPL